MAELISSSVPLRLTIEAFKRDTFVRVFNVTSSGTAYDFTGSTLVFAVKKTLNDATPLISRSIGSGISVSGGAVTVTIPDTSIRALGDFKGYYDLTHTSSGGIITTFAYGPFVLARDVA